MPDDITRSRQAKTLLETAKTPNDPSSMAKILGVSGEGLWEFLQNAYENMVPQSAEEWGLELSPAGKAIGAGAKMLAGLPFAHYVPKLPAKAVGHGTTGLDNLTKGIDPQRLDKYDLLGWMLHGAEDPRYFNSYAEGTAKNTFGGNRSGVVPLSPPAKNVLDLVDPNVDDLATVVGNTSDTYDRHRLLSSFKDAVRIRRENPAQGRARMRISEQHFPLPELDWKQLKENPLADPVVNNLPAVSMSERVRVTPEDFTRMPFDAIRYNDMTNKSWAFDLDKVPITTKLGTEIPVHRPNQQFKARFRGGPPGTPAEDLERSFAPSAADLNDLRLTQLDEQKVLKINEAKASAKIADSQALIGKLMEAGLDPSLADSYFLAPHTNTYLPDVTATYEALTKHFDDEIAAGLFTPKEKADYLAAYSLKYPEKSPQALVQAKGKKYMSKVLLEK